MAQPLAHLVAIQDDHMRSTQLALGLLTLLLCSGVHAAAPDFNLSHHIHNWSRIVNGATPKRARSEQHALSMGYVMVNKKKAGDSQFSQLAVMKDFNAGHYPVVFDFNGGKSRFRDDTDDGAGFSTLRRDRVIGKDTDLDPEDMALLSQFGCSKTDPEPLLATDATVADFESTFYAASAATDLRWSALNLQSRWVVNQMIDALLESIRRRDHAAVMMDDLLPNISAGCANREAGGQGSYASYMDGKKDFVKRLTDILHAETSPYGSAYLVAGNVWQISSPQFASTYGAWYADGSLRLDLYYLEKGTQDGNNQIASSRDPQTRLPAFSYQGAGIPSNFVPASRVVLNTAHKTYPPTTQFVTEHLRVAGMAGAQGSWFGFTLAMNLDQQYADGSWVFNNTLQLLRAVPNFDNLARVPLGSRRYSASAMTYTSPNSQSSPSVVQSRNPLNGELYAVFLRSSGAIRLNLNEAVSSAVFVDPLFNPTSESALSCLRVGRGFVTLSCASRVGQGIRLTLQRSGR